MRIPVIAVIAMSGLVALIAVGGAALSTTAAPARADATQDQEFYRLLTESDQDHPMVIWNFAEVRLAGISACQREDAGVPPFQALKDLEYPNGPYNFDDANSITSSAEVVYCPWHSAPEPAENWDTTSAPVDPRPVYPPLEWYPPPSAYYPPPGGAS